MANNDNVINILEEHKVYKHEYNDGWIYFGEMNENKKPMNIGMFYCTKYNSPGTFMMMENVKGKFDGEGMCITHNPKNNISSVGYCHDGKQIGPQLISNKKGDLCYCCLDERGEKVGFAIDISDNKYTIYQCFKDGSTSFKAITFEDGVFYFEDLRRKEDNKYVRIFDGNQNYGFKCGDGLIVDDFDYKKAIVPTTITKKGPRDFVVSGGAQAFKEGNRVKSNYDEYFKELRYDSSISIGYGIKYYSNAYFFGQFDTDGKREKAGCLRKNKNAFMGNFYKDVLYGPVLTIENGITRLCSYDNGKKYGTYFEDRNDHLYITSRNKTKDNNIVYKIDLDSFKIMEIDCSGANKVLRSASYPFKEDDEESLRQEKEKNKEIKLLKSLNLGYEDYKELENFNYEIENKKIKILSLKKATKYLNIPKCAKILADNAFNDKNLCGEIVTVNIRAGVETIGENCFSVCEKLSKLSMGNNVHEIKKGAFKGSAVELITFSDSTKIIRTEAFADCENLKEVIVTKGCLIEEGAFPEWTKITIVEPLEKRVKETIRMGNPIYRFFSGIFKKKNKKRKLTPGEEKAIKEKKVKKEVKKRYKSSFGEKIQDVLRILALPFIYIAKGIAWLFSGLFKGIKALFGGIRDFLGDMEITKEHVLIVLPFVLLLGYTIFAFVYGVDKLEAFNTSKVMYDGYDWELSGAASNWMEETDHNFFTAITLGLLQIILIVVGFVLDIVLSIVILVLGFILMILAGILKFVVMELLPLAVLAIYLIMLKFVSKSDKGLLVTCMILSLVMGVVYYVVLLA